ncbi:hypothetical protein ACFQDE_02360 [Deinococcus caeni]|uniref:hypothetical protein n=1 Tax=Deinococcus TaxID=1298 RepID=UPI000991EE15|nr:MULTISPECIES: hypothetical protein [unclassified Deinococcus]OOV15494.1 hypothetical protein BXU09_13430 [Deinococcus sp. LM3]
MNRPLFLPPAWLARLSAWPGVLTVLSLLAVGFGTPAPAPEVGERLSAGRVTPVLPELRPAPGAPTPTPFPASPPPEPLPWAAAVHAEVRAVRAWSPPLRRPALSVLGRRQSDGG